MRCDDEMLSDVVRFLEQRQVVTWVFGGWAEELRAITSAHADIDLLYPSNDFSAIDELIRDHELEEITAKRLPHKRALRLAGVMVEIFLIGPDGRGWHTMFWGETRHEWPADVLSMFEGQRIASTAALKSYRAAHPQLHQAQAMPSPRRLLSPVR